VDLCEGWIKPLKFRSTGCFPKSTKAQNLMLFYQQELFQQALLCDWTHPRTNAGKLELWMSLAEQAEL